MDVHIFMNWFVYILRCSDGSYYTGYTNDMEKRLDVHNIGQGAKYTRSRRPCKVVFTEQQETKSDALKREAQIKKLSRKKKEALIVGL